MFPLKSYEIAPSLQQQMPIFELFDYFNNFLIMFLN